MVQRRARSLSRCFYGARQWGTAIVNEVIKAGCADEVANALCKLLTGIGDQSGGYLADNIVSDDIVAPAYNPVSAQGSALPSRGSLSRHIYGCCYRLLLSLGTLV